MKRGVTYIITLVSIGLLYFGSLYVVSRPSTACLSSLVNERADLTNRESVENAGAQVPLSNENVVKDDQDVDKLIDKYTTVEIKPSCEKLPSDDKKEKAVIVILVRNNELAAMRRTLRQFEE
jgi:alpha 1,2-mannosyltransferase